MTRKIVLKALDLTRKVSSPGGSLTIVDQVSLEIAAGESVALVGASGAGKSTLLALLAGLDEDARAHLRAERVGFVFQAFHLLPALTALENVMLPLELAGHAEARDMALAMLRRVGLGERAEHYPRQLSGGEQQRVALARATVTRPPVLFADEPTGNLDTATGEAICQLLFDLNAETGTTLVLVTHDTQLAARCQRVLTLRAGKLV